MTEDPVRICVIGAGLAGLSAAFYLTRYPGVSVTVYEQAASLGGRANISADGEHCPRVFLNDYHYLFRILREVSNEAGGSLYETLRAVHRYCYLAGRGWAEISHLYAVLASELSPSDRLRLARARRSSPLAAAHLSGKNENRYGSIRNISPVTMFRVLANLRRSRIAFALAGPTDQYLIGPWVRHLETAGVTFRRSQRVSAIVPLPDGVTISTNSDQRRYDVVIVTAFAPDLVQLLTASGIGHRIKDLNHNHCKCLTIDLDPRERILASGQVALYSRDGINVVLQPDHRRCVVLCIRPFSTDLVYVVSRVREFLGLEHEITGIKARDNQQPREAIYAADYVRPETILRPSLPHIYFAGSYIKNSYPIDSGESAARSAFNAVSQIERDYDLTDGAAAGTASDPPRLDVVSLARAGGQRAVRIARQGAGG
jgi:glycine/D-amino acid oxidase-like deaminating enzyme